MLVVSVKTPVELTEEYKIGECVAQGSVEGVSISAANLRNGLNDVFKDSYDELNFSGVQLGPLLYQDDVARIADKCC